MQVLLILLSRNQAEGFSFNFLFGSDYVGKTFVVHSPNIRAFLNRQLTNEDEDGRVVANQSKDVGNLNKTAVKVLKKD